MGVGLSGVSTTMLATFSASDPLAGLVGSAGPALAGIYFGHQLRSRSNETVETGEVAA